MASHPNRGQRTAASKPKPDEVRAWREAAGLTSGEAGALVHGNDRTWRRWELGSKYESGRDMHPAFMELARIKHALNRCGWTVDDLLTHLEAMARIRETRPPRRAEPADER